MRRIWLGCTFWIESNSQVEAAVKLRDVELPAFEGGLRPQHDLAVKLRVRHFSSPGFRVTVHSTSCTRLMSSRLSSRVVIFGFSSISLIVPRMEKLTYKNSVLVHR